MEIITPRVDVAVFEADIDAIIDRVEAGQRITLTRDGRDVVILEPTSDQRRTGA